MCVVVMAVAVTVAVKRKASCEEDVGLKLLLVTSPPALHLGSGDRQISYLQSALTVKQVCVKLQPKHRTIIE
jgi:hypothetical protein